MLRVRYGQQCCQVPNWKSLDVLSSKMLNSIEKWWEIQYGSNNRFPLASSRIGAEILWLFQFEKITIIWSKFEIMKVRSHKNNVSGEQKITSLFSYYSQSCKFCPSIQSVSDCEIRLHNYANKTFLNNFWGKSWNFDHFSHDFQILKEILKQPLFYQILRFC